MDPLLGALSINPSRLFLAALNNLDYGKGKPSFSTGRSTEAVCLVIGRAEGRTRVESVQDKVFTGCSLVRKKKTR